MRPFDAALLREESAIRRPIAALGGIGVVQGVLAIAQAVVVAQLVVAVVHGSALLRPAVFVIVVFGLRAFVGGAGERVAAWAGSYVANVLRRNAIRGWLAQSSDSRPSETVMLSRVTHGAETIEPYVARYLPALISAAIVPTFALIALVWTDWVSALIVLLTLPLLPLFAALIGIHTRDEVAARWRETDRLTGHFLDVMRGLPTLVNYQRAERQVSVVRQVGDRLRRATVRTLRTAFLSSAALELLATISVAIVAVAVGLRLVHGELGLQVGLVAILLAPEAYWPIRRVGQEFHAAAEGATAIDDLRGTEPIVDPPAADGMTLCADGVSYSYPGANSPVLQALRLDLDRGMTALTGPSGVGKTTVLDLLAGLRTPTSGDIVRPAGGVHYVMQRPFVIPGTLGDNLSLGGELPTGTDWLPDALRRLPQGLETPIGDDGFGLSAGQRALLALTRARLSNASVILLDEPTAHLDADMRHATEALIRELSATRIVVVATHSEALIALADNVVRLSGVSEPSATPVSPTRVPAAAAPIGDDPSLAESADATTQSSVWRPARGVLRAAIIGALAATCGVALTATSGWLIVQASTRPPVLSLLVAIVCVRAFGIARPVLRYVERIRSHDAALHDLVERRASLFARLIPLTPARLGRRHRADVLTGAVADLDDEVDVQVRTLVPLIAAAVASLIALVVVTALHPTSGAILAVVLIAAAAAAWWDFRLERGAQRHTLETRARVNRASQLITTNLPAVQAISVGERLLGRLDSAAYDAARATSRQANGRAVGVALNTAIAGIGVVLTALVAHQGVSAGTISAPVAALLVLGPLALMDVLGDLPDAVGSAARGEQARARLDDLTHRPPAVYDAKLPTDSTLRRRPEITLTDVRASWTGDRDDLSLEELRVAPGERISVTGPNGAGKSTLLAVIARHLEIASGSYEFAGREVQAVPLVAIRSQCAIVDDEPHVFAGSVRANLLLARPDADDAAVAGALVDAGLGRWLALLPHGLDTALGAGRALSGGERTRLAIARAVLSQRPVLLLDEPVAHLDSPTARAVMADVRAATSGASVVAVSHQAVAELAPDREFAIRVAGGATSRVTVSSW